MMNDDHETSAFRPGRKKSSLGLSCCFNAHHRLDSCELSPSSPLPSPEKTSSKWIRSKIHDSSEIKTKCINFISRMGRHRRHASAELSYDPLSYSLNFDDDEIPETEEFPSRNFAARLPASPPRRMLSLTRNYKTATTTKIGFSDRPSPTKSIEVSRCEDSISTTTKATMKERRNNVDKSILRAEAIAEVRKSLEEVSPTMATTSCSKQEVSTY